MKREGSPFKGVMTVALKEAADHMTSARMHLIMLLVLLTAIGAVYGAITHIRDTTSEDPFLFLKLFTTARQPLPSFASFLGFLLLRLLLQVCFVGLDRFREFCQSFVHVDAAVLVLDLARIASKEHQAHFWSILKLCFSLEIL